ncbi:DUF459 domain-containing protein [Sphingomonas jatrophae]|uniref:Uncharacterized protein n=1 Tax=Sphingomonas jatrophae TaxID=1166337 RepID=A0A1I6MAH2_9SPHN|nr:DUF459 domain-containing protein [Sphingomonas jatrophae]SFS12724.1 hypothetical protein SAMN05192580_3797 [Sphingomonas jatrophae]
MKPWLAVVDRTAVLFLGIAAGVLIGLSFKDEAPAPLPGLPAPQGVEPGTLPPPPNGPAAPGQTPAETPTAPAAPQAAPEVAAVLGARTAAGQQLFETVRTDRPVRVGVFGDSFGDGVWSGLNRLLPAKDGYRVIKYSQQATGFTRYKSLNLESHAAAQLGQGPLDIAVISYGANDTQGVYTGNGRAAALLTPAWQAEIGARVERFVALLRAHGAQVYWVGLPRMRKTAFDSDIQRMNAFYTAKMAQLGVPFIDTRPFSSDASGAYAAYLPDPKDGHRVLIRADDGIHMSMNGYVWITRSLAQRIRALVDAARQVASGQPMAAPVAPAPAPVAIVPPAPPRPERPRPEPARVEPVRSEPVRPAPARAEPSRPEPSRTEPPRAERVREPSRTEPARTERPRDPARAEPARTPPSPTRRLPEPSFDLTPADLGQAPGNGSDR